MGAACSFVENSHQVVFQKRKSKDVASLNTLKAEGRPRKRSTTSSSEVNFKVQPKELLSSPTTTVKDGVNQSEEENEITTEDDTMQEAAVENFSLKEVTAEANNDNPVTDVKANEPVIEPEQWKIPPRLSFLTLDLQELLLGHPADLSRLMEPLRVIRLKVIAPGEDCMKERLILWENVFSSLRLSCAMQGYVLDIVDDLWSSSNLDKAYAHLYSQTFSDDTDDAVHLLDGLDVDTADILLLVLAETFKPRLPLSLSHEDYTLTLVSLPDSSTTALFHDLYANNENRIPPAYELKHHVLVRQDEVKVGRLTELMMEIFRREQKDLHLFLTDYCQQIKTVLQDSPDLLQRCVLLMRSSDAAVPAAGDDVYVGALYSSGDHDQMASMVMAVKNECPQTNQIKYTFIPIKTEAPQTIEDVANTSSLLKMSQKVKERLEAIVRKVIEVKSSDAKVIATGVPRNLIEELVTQAKHYQRLTGVMPLFESPTLSSLQDYLSHVSEMPIVMYADPGWGLSTLGSQLVKLCVNSLPTTVIIYRFIGISPDSHSLLATLLSIKQQLDVMLGPNPLRGQEETKEPLIESLLKDIVFRSSKQLPMLIILEGLSLLSGQMKELDIMALSEMLPVTTKLLILTSDVDAARGLRAKMKDAFYVKAVDWEHEVVMELFNSQMARSRRSLTDSQKALVISSIQSCPLPMYAIMMSRLAVTWRGLTEVSNETLPTTLEGILDQVFETLEKNVPSDCFTAMMAYLTGSLGGIAPWEMLDLLSVNDSVLLSVYSDVNDPPIHRSPTILWSFASNYLIPFLSIFQSRDFLLYTWSSNCLRKSATNRYISSPVTSTILHRELSDHFQGRWSNKKKPFPDPEEEIELLQDRFIISQPDQYGHHFNVRKFMCLPFHLVRSKTKNAVALEKCIFHLPWVQCKLEAVSVLQVVCDLELAKSMETSSTKVIQQMQQAIVLNSSILHVDCREIYKYLKPLLTNKTSSSEEESSNALNVKNNGLVKFYACLTNPSRSLLHLLDEILPPSYNNTFLSPPVIDAIVPVAGDVHVAAVLRSEGEIKIFNTVTNVCVRTLTGADSPQSLVMLDFPKAVVLCNRELYVMDLDEGKIVSKLRGVLNLMKPFFGLQNKNRVVVLSRDRMVVNILNIETDSIVASFKAGEARFLDSLILSADGSTLVCGDETQKPFPLLVWSLEHCKLLHDIRVPQHEFLTHLADISPDGHYLICVCREVNSSESGFVALCDLNTGQLYKKFKTEASCTALAIASKSLAAVVALDTGQLSVWDIVSGDHKFVMEGPKLSIDTLVITPSGKSCLTYCRQDGSISSYTLCLWDLEQGEFVASHTFQSPITSAYITSDSRLVLAGVKGYACPMRLMLVPAGSTLASVKSKWELEKDGEHVCFGEESRQGTMINLAMGAD
ncbi:NACHT and WD repeat domain-containing protein 2 [Biomphalaria glabrata]|nr:NACHT and WD repeat domain-containing protein 2 [Biomphalaria glabrata]